MGEEEEEEESGTHRKTSPLSTDQNLVSETKDGHYNEWRVNPRNHACFDVEIAFATALEWWKEGNTRAWEYGNGAKERAIQVITIFMNRNEKEERDGEGM